MAWVLEVDRCPVRVGIPLVYIFLDREGVTVGCKRGCADGLPLGRYAVPDPDDEDRMTYWRVEESGRHRVLRPWPADVRWAPWRPPYPEGLDREQRREWSQRWYDEVFFGWKDAVIAAIAADHQAAADEFARSAPTADLPEPVRKRPRVRVRPKPVSKKQRQIAAEALLAEALRRAGMSERGIAGELGLPKTTAHRRLAGAKVVDSLSQVFLEAEIARLISRVMEAALTAGPEDLPRLVAQIEQVRKLQARAAGVQADEGGADGLGVFGPRLAGGSR
jgi:hypothetical protein